MTRRIHKSQKVCFRDDSGQHVGKVAVVQRVSQGTAEIRFKNGLTQNVPVELLIQYGPKRPLIGQLQLF